MKLLKKLTPLLALLALLNTSCTKEYITEEYVTENIGSQVRTFIYDVQPADWKVAHSADGRNYWYAEFDNFNLTNSVLEYGAVTADILYTYDIESNAQSWNKLPYVFPFTTVDNKVIGENIRFEYEHERVTFVIEDLDGATPEDILGELTFKLSIITK